LISAFGRPSLGHPDYLASLCAVEVFGQRLLRLPDADIHVSALPLVLCPHQIQIDLSHGADTAGQSSSMKKPFAGALVLAVALTLPATSIGAVILEGTFGPTEKYTGRGTATVVSGANGARTLKLSSNFRAFNAVRLELYLATSPSATKHITLGPMRDRGAQRFRLAKTVSLSRYKYVTAWCTAVDEPITQAILR
jgi:hypothetical protein